MGRLLSYPRAVILLFLLPVITIVFAALAPLICASLSLMDWWLKLWGSLLCRLSGIKIHFSGGENLQGLQSVILVSNHSGLFDIPALYAVLPVSFRMAAKIELFRIPVFGWAMRAAGFVPLDRRKPETAVTALTSSRDKFARGQSLWIAPEGTRFKGTGVGEFKSGAFFLALEGKLPVVPICIYGTQNVLPKKSLLVNWGRYHQDVYVRVLKPVSTSELSRDSRVRLKEAVREMIVDEFFRFHKSSAGPHPQS